MSTVKPFLDKSLFFLNLAGLNPQNQNIFSKIRALFAIFSTGLLTLLLTLEVVINWRGIDSLLAGASSVAAYGQIVIQMVLIMRALNIIKTMVNDVNNFWSLDGTNPIVLKEIEEDHKFVKRLLRFIQICYLLAIAAYFIQPLFIKIRKFPIQLYQPINLLISPRYEITYLLLFINALLVIPFLIGFDMIYITIILHVISELKIIKYGFENIDVNEAVNGDDPKCLKEFGRLVDHHSSVLQ
ncbi:hypothetical protein FQR65_LT10072 [Abscondita terminalis]|nr:hypothetical protein FQR65_LT10072 [Abscondita terminalis]